jgi:hypothetical protein
MQVTAVTVNRRPVWTNLRDGCYKPRMLRKPWLMAAILMGCAALVWLAAGPRVLKQLHSPVLNVGTSQHK